jgi:hypothetical protein
LLSGYIDFVVVVPVVGSCERVELGTISLSRVCCCK